ncbi:hypothetical protein VB776_15785 [Arcicella sp. DC2W]|uniref:Uncharacterized protein n=1 Tax=Arcicella gelida TaxID=2984195 RepID=A0ABU5S7K9_9BACT|nr:hypothetical protein [Arcicella sp. DC2W]MEA5404394.1 hypothetical protein [Arcicella sp. DC2W]
MTLYEEVIAALKSNDKTIQNNAIYNFRTMYRKHLKSHAKQKYLSDNETEKEIDNTLKMILSAIIEYDYLPKEDELIKRLRKTVSLTHYENRLTEEMLRFINQKETDYLSIEKKIRKILNPFLQLFNSTKNNHLLINVANQQLMTDWISQQTFDYYIYKTLGKDEKITKNRLAKLHHIIQETYLIFTIRYSQNESAKRRAESNINELCRLSFAAKRNTDDDLFSESMELLFSELSRKDFILKTSIQRYWQGIFDTLLDKSHREKSSSKVVNHLKIPADKSFSLEEVFLFIQDGLDAIEKVHAGNARRLLLTGRKSHFIKLVIEATLAEASRAFFNSSKNYNYKNKQSEAQQRQDCKKALIDWMKNEINLPESTWGNAKGKAIYQYICHEKP